jgi:hypothetical protein
MRDRHELAVLHIEAERLVAAKIAIALPLIGLHLGNALANAVALCLGHDRIVNTSLDMPLPVTSPPRSIMCSETFCRLSRSSTSRASRAERVTAHIKNLQISLHAVTNFRP